MPGIGGKAWTTRGKSCRQTCRQVYTGGKSKPSNTQKPTQTAITNGSTLQPQETVRGACGIATILHRKQSSPTGLRTESHVDNGESMHGTKATMQPSCEAVCQARLHPSACGGLYIHAMPPACCCGQGLANHEALIDSGFTLSLPGAIGHWRLGVAAPRPGVRV